MTIRRGHSRYSPNRLPQTNLITEKQLPSPPPQPATVHRLHQTANNDESNASDAINDDAPLLQRRLRYNEDSAGQRSIRDSLVLIAILDRLTNGGDRKGPEIPNISPIFIIYSRIRNFLGLFLKFGIIFCVGPLGLVCFGALLPLFFTLVFIH